METKICMHIFEQRKYKGGEWNWMVNRHCVHKQTLLGKRTSLLERNERLMYPKKKKEKNKELIRAVSFSSSSSFFQLIIFDIYCVFISTIRVGYDH